MIFSRIYSHLCVAKQDAIFTYFYVHVSFYQIIWVQSLIGKSQKHYFLRIFGRICRWTPVERGRQELKLKLGHELLFTKEIIHIKLFHLDMKDLQ